MLKIMLWRIAKGALISGAGAFLGALSESLNREMPHVGPIAGMIASNVINILYQLLRDAGRGNSEVVDGGADREHVPARVK